MKVYYMLENIPRTTVLTHIQIILNFYAGLDTFQKHALSQKTTELATIVVRKDISQETALMRGNLGHEFGHNTIRVP